MQFAQTPMQLRLALIPLMALRVMSFLSQMMISPVVCQLDLTLSFSATPTQTFTFAPMDG
jgi:hypothetical protein